MTEREATTKKDRTIAILGGGVSGTTIAWELYFKNISFSLSDLRKPKASNKAAGLFNPIVFRKLTLSWQAEKLIAPTFEFYKKIEDLTSTRFFFPRPLKKILSMVEEVNNWETKKALASHSKFLGKVEPYRGGNLGEVNYGGYCDLPKFIKASHHFFNQKGLINSLANANTFIHCKGSYESENGLFSYLPFSPTKGETLTLKIPNLNLNYVLKKHYFLIPLGNELYRFGATYNWDDSTWKTTEDGRSLLIEKLEELVDLPYEIIVHSAGVRPTTRDRRPFLGEHPSEKGNFIFNGLGSKGVMIAPYYAKHLVNHIFDQQALEKEVDIKRYEKYFQYE